MKHDLQWYREVLIGTISYEAGDRLNLDNIEKLVDDLIQAAKEEALKEQRAEPKGRRG